MTFNAALAALLDLDDLDTEFPTPTPSAIARAAELVPPMLDVRLSTRSNGDLRVHISTAAYRRLTLAVPAEPDLPVRIYWRRRRDDVVGAEPATIERWVGMLAQGAPMHEAARLLKSTGG